MDKDGGTPTHSGDKPIGDSLHPIKGDFVPVSPRAKGRSSSPRRRDQTQPVHFRVNPTDRQMEKFTSAIASPTDNEQLPCPAVRPYAHYSDPITPSNKFDQAMSNSRPYIDTSLSKSHPCHDGIRTLSHHNGVGGFASSFSYPRLRSLSPEKELSSSHSQATLAERRHKYPLARLTIDDSNAYGDPYLQCVIPIQTVPESHTPRGRVSAATGCEWDSESVYSGDDNTAARVGPLRLSSRGNGGAGINMGDNTILEYYNWKHSSPGDRNAAAHPTPEDFSPDPASNGLKAGKACERNVAQPRRHALYSPLTPFFADNDVPVDKKGSKTLFGQNGWLERTGQTPEKKKDHPLKKSMFDGLKKVAKDLTNSGRRSRDEEKHMQLYSSVAISLDPREQSLLYCELEFYLSCAIHGYITVQLNHGRLDPDKLKKIADAWTQKGRPKIIGFRFDLETQVELIGLHIGQFRFHGRRQGNEAQISGLLHTMKVNSRAMRIRTFCQPDSVIAKQLVDAQSFFNLLGVPDIQQHALQQVAQFFKVIVERERHRAGRHESDRTHAVSGWVDYQWEGGCRNSQGKVTST